MLTQPMGTLVLHILTAQGAAVAPVLLCAYHRRMLLPVQDHPDRLHLARLSTTSTLTCPQASHRRLCTERLLVPAPASTTHVALAMDAGDFLDVLHRARCRMRRLRPYPHTHALTLHADESLRVPAL